MRQLLARCCAIMCAMVSASTWRGITRSKSAAIVSSVGASPERSDSDSASMSEFSGASKCLWKVALEAASRS